MKKNRIFSILGILLLALSIGLFIWYEWGGGRELVHYDDVVVLKSDVKKGQLITDDLLQVIKVQSDLLIQDVIRAPKDILGKEANHYIPAQSQLHPTFFVDAGLVLKEGQYVAQIPIEWTLAVPDSLRRGDQIVIYAAQYEKKIMNSLQPKRQSSENKSENDDTDKSIDTNINISEDDEKTDVLEESVATQPAFEELLNTTVAFVKDSANREVITVSDTDRLDGSAVIRNVEIITTLDDFKEIENQINQGAKLIVMYADKAIN